MTLTKKGTRVETAEATVEEILQSDQKIVAISKGEKEDDEILESEKREKEIVE